MPRTSTSSFGALLVLLISGVVGAVQVTPGLNGLGRDPQSGQSIDVYFVDAVGGGNCSPNSPCTLQFAQTDRFYGAGDVIVLLAEAGVIKHNVTLTDPRQQLIGGGDCGVRTVVLSSGVELRLTDLGARPRIQGIVTLADGSVLDGFTVVNSPGPGVFSENITAATVDDVQVVNAVDYGIRLLGSDVELSNVHVNDSVVGIHLGSNSGGRFTLSNSTIRNTSSIGLVIFDTDRADVSNVEIADTGSRGIVVSGGPARAALFNVNVARTDDDAVFLQMANVSINSSTFEDIGDGDPSDDVIDFAFDSILGTSSGNRIEGRISDGVACRGTATGRMEFVSGPAGLLSGPTCFLVPGGSTATGAGGGSVIVRDPDCPLGSPVVAGEAPAARSGNADAIIYIINSLLLGP